MAALTHDIEIRPTVLQRKWFYRPLGIWKEIRYVKSLEIGGVTVYKIKYIN
jgi:hypothetical protein